MVRRSGGRRRIEPRTTRSGEAIPIDVEDRGEEYVLLADLPGLRTQDVDLTVRGSRVAVTADFGNRERRSRREGDYRRRERPASEVTRVVELPEKVVAERADAELLGGVLRVRLPKRSRPKRVDVE